MPSGVPSQISPRWSSSKLLTSLSISPSDSSRNSGKGPSGSKRRIPSVVPIQITPLLSFIAFPHLTELLVTIVFICLRSLLSTSIVSFFMTHNLPWRSSSNKTCHPRPPFLLSMVAAVFSSNEMAIGPFSAASHILWFESWKKYETRSFKIST